MQLVNGKLSNSTECNLNSMLRRVRLLLGTRKLQAYDQVSSLEPFAKPVLKTDFNEHLFYSTWPTWSFVSGNIFYFLTLHKPFSTVAKDIKMGSNWFWDDNISGALVTLLWHIWDNALVPCPHTDHSKSSVVCGRCSSVLWCNQLENKHWVKKSNPVTFIYYLMR